MLQCTFVSGLRMLSQNENSCLLNAFQYSTHGSSEPSLFYCEVSACLGTYFIVLIEYDCQYLPQSGLADDNRLNER